MSNDADQTGRFEFAPLGQDDLPFLLDIRNECRDFLHDNRSFTLPECVSWFTEQSPDFHLIRYDGEPIGYFRLSDHDLEARSIYVGADLEARSRGRGLARRAYEAFLPVVRERYGVTVAKLEVLSHNRRAYELYRRLGFVEVDRVERFVVRAGQSVDSIVMERSL